MTEPSRCDGLPIDCRHDPLGRARGLWTSQWSRHHPGRRPRSQSGAPIPSSTSRYSLPPRRGQVGERSGESLVKNGGPGEDTPGHEISVSSVKVGRGVCRSKITLSSFSSLLTYDHYPSKSIVPWVREHIKGECNWVESVLWTKLVNLLSFTLYSSPNFSRTRKSEGIRKKKSGTLVAPSFGSDRTTPHSLEKLGGIQFVR